MHEESERGPSGPGRGSCGCASSIKEAVLNAVRKIDDESDHQPNHQAHPGHARQRKHKPKSRKSSERRNYLNVRGFECSGQIWLPNSQHKDANRNNHEGQECPNITKVSGVADGKNRTTNSDNDAGEDSCDPGRLETRMYSADKRRKQAVPRHGPENASLTEHHHEDD